MSVTIYSWLWFDVVFKRTAITGYGR